MRVLNTIQATILGIAGAVQAQSAGLRPPPTYGWNYSPISKDNEAISLAYQDVDVELFSPAFLRPETIPTETFANGTSGPTNETTLGVPAFDGYFPDKANDFPDDFLRDIASRHDWFNYEIADFKSEQGRPIFTAFLSNPKSKPTNSTKLRVWLQAAIHGNEPAADQGAMALLGKMDANTTWTASLLEKMDIFVMPRYNPDGVHYFQREFASNIDPNREHTKLVKQHSQDVKQLFSSFDAHISIDMHEFAGHNVYSGRYRHGLDAMIGGGKNLNIHPLIRNLSEGTFVANMGSLLESRGMRWGPYVLGDTSDVEGSPILFEELSTMPASGTNNYGMTQTVSILTEVRGQWLADQHFQRRTAASLTMVESILDTARDNSQEVLEVLSAAAEDYINSDEEIILTDSQPSSNRTFTMVDIRNGSVVEVPIEFKTTTPSLANMTRPRPEAYLIPRNWGAVANRLRIMGVEVEELKYEYRGTVQAYNITSSTLDTEVTEGTVRNTVTTEPYIKEDLWLPAGSWRVSSRQKNAALAFVTLEPETFASFTYFGILPVGAGYEYPIFREEREAK